MLAIALALGAAVSWGFADYFSGIQARRHSILTILLFGSSAGLLAIAVAVAVRGVEAPGTKAIVSASLAGVAATVGLAFFYRALAMGQISLVTPIAAVGVVVPVLGGVIQGERPSPIQVAGIVTVICGVAIASREHDSGGTSARATIFLAVGAAVFLGLGIVGLGVAADDDPYWTILIFRGVTVGIAIVVALAVRHRPAAGGADARIIVLLGLLDVLGFTLLAVATTEGLLSIVVVLAALYPVVAIALARARLGERLRSDQALGVTLALLGVLLIAGGS